MLNCPWGESLLKAEMTITPCSDLRFIFCVHNVAADSLVQCNNMPGTLYDFCIVGCCNSSTWCMVFLHTCCQEKTMFEMPTIVYALCIYNRCHHLLCVPSQLNHSNHFTLHHPLTPPPPLTDLFIPTPTRLQWESRCNYSTKTFPSHFQCCLARYSFIQRTEERMKMPQLRNSLQMSLCNVMLL